MVSTVSQQAGPTPDELDAVLRDIIDAAQRTYPAFGLPRDVYVAYLRERIPADVPQAVALLQMHTADLYLACACARGDLQALVAFDERCLSHLDPALGKMGIDADVIAEVKQDIRSRVLVGAHGRAEIVDFRGRGDLRGWVRVMAARQAVSRQSRARREVAVEDDELLQHMVTPASPELAYLKELYRHAFKQAFESALRALPDREQTVLRQHYVDGATLDELASLYRVHRATAARLLARARELVLDATRDRLTAELGVRSQDLDSILGMIWSQVEISLRGLRRGRRS